MPSARIRVAAVTGIDGHLVQVEASISDGLPATILTGLPEGALREARDRIRAAIINSGERWPDQRITITVTSTAWPVCGSGFDLAIAISVLAAQTPVISRSLDEIVFLAELGLDGSLRNVPGLLGCRARLRERAAADPGGGGGQRGRSAAHPAHHGHQREHARRGHHLAARPSNVRRP